MPIQAAVVGCGNFARAIHLPNLTASPDYNVRAVVDIDADRAWQAAEQFGASYSSHDYRTILDDPQVELVIICTPHDEHASMALDAVNAGKHVHVEKPMALKIEEIRPLVDAVRRQRVTLTTGFNRRYSSLAKKAKELLRNRTYPLVVNYRMADGICRRSWVMDPEVGGGRIISEGVHFLDFCAFLVGSEPVRIYAEGGSLSHPDMPDTQDNAVISMRFADGSIASIMICDLGSIEYPKERVEVFSDERTILIDNYERLELHGFDGEHDISLPAADKGFAQEIAELADAIKRRKPAPVTEIDGARATLCAVKAVEAIHTGCPQDLDLAGTIGQGCKRIELAFDAVM